MKDIFTVAKFTAKDMLSRKSFRISTIIILMLIVLGCNIPNIINDFTDGEGINNTIAIIDEDNVFNNALNTLVDASIDPNIEINQDNLDTIKQKITNGELSSALIITKTDNTPTITYLVKNTATADSLPPSLLTSLNYLYTNVQANKLNLTPSQIQSLMPDFTINVEQTETTEIGGDLLTMMMVSTVLFFAIYFCTYQVSSAITVEKTSRIIETLVTSTSPSNIVIGKTLGIGVVGLFQLIIIVTTAIISANLFMPSEILASMFDLSNITIYLGIITLLYFILGYFEYAFAYALTGATVSKPEDIQPANTPIAIITMIGFYLAYFTLMDPTSGLNSFAALLPISSPFCMPIRIMMGIASGWEVLLSLIILVATIAIIARISIKIYSDAILNYGTRLSLRELFKNYKQK